MNKTALAGVFLIVAGMAVGHGASRFGEKPDEADRREAICKKGMNGDPHSSGLSWETVKACSNMPSIWLHRAVH